jgi:phosphoribosylglycinamide formyltransferase 1
MRLVNKRLCILLSGRGSNFVALSDWLSAQSLPIEISCVVSNRPHAPGLAAARERGIEAICFDTQQSGGMVAFEAALEQALHQKPADLIVLAGFMRILSAEFCERHRNRVLNIHPSLLPAFTGLRTHERALAEGARVHGATVHAVNAELDAGAILAQGVVPVLDGDTPERLSARVLEIEHLLFPQAIAAVAGGLMRMGPRGWVRGSPEPGFESCVFSPILLHPTFSKPPTSP